MAYSAAQNKATQKYKSENIKRIPLDVQKSKYEEIKSAADSAGEKVNEYIKNAIEMRMSASNA